MCITKISATIDLDSTEDGYVTISKYLKFEIVTILRGIYMSIENEMNVNVVESSPKVELTAEAITSAKTFEELFEAINASSGLQGSRWHTAEELIKEITDARRGYSVGMNIDKILDSITRTGGLREKVKALLEAENKTV